MISTFCWLDFLYAHVFFNLFICFKSSFCIFLFVLFVDNFEQVNDNRSRYGFCCFVEYKPSDGAIFSNPKVLKTIGIFSSIRLDLHN